MENISVLRDIIIIFTVSIGVVFLFKKHQFTSISRFLVAGSIVGPYGLNKISDSEQVQVLAEVGVILLLFTIGLEFSLTQLKSTKSLFLIAGPAQVFGVLLLIM
ncbi:MAG: cation:proton antiporter, partial [Nitrospirota bacterium]|nr:cation:proton antiporter [Nitrospirota bacterium]